MKHKQNKSIPLSYLGYSSQLRALDFFIDNHFFDFPLTEIARGSNVSYNSLTFIQNWLEKGIIVKTRKIGKAEYFQLNLKNQFVKNIKKSFHDLETFGCKQTFQVCCTENFKHKRNSLVLKVPQFHNAL